MVTQDGTTEAAFDDRQLIGQRDYPYVFLDRRTKSHSNVLKRGHLGAHARSVCLTWRDAGGRPPREVVIASRSWPLPDPRWLAAQGPIDPRPYAERYRTDRVRYRLRCAD